MVPRTASAWNQTLSVCLYAAACHCTDRSSLNVNTNNYTHSKSCHNVGEGKGRKVKLYRGCRNTTPSLLTLALHGGEWLTSHLSYFTHGERAFGTHRTAGWVGPRTSPDTLEKRSISCPCPASNSRSSSP
jgi:hypothetical protein